MPVVRTGPVRVSGYAIKLRRVINAVLRDRYKSGELDAKLVNKLISELNARIYQVLVEKFEVPKEAVANIVVDFDVEDGKMIINDIQIEVFDKDEILSENATKEVKRLIEKMPITIQETSGEKQEEQGQEKE